MTLPLIKTKYTFSDYLKPSFLSNNKSKILSVTTMSKIPSVKAEKQNNHTASTAICRHYSQLLKLFQFLTGKLCT